MSYNPYGYMSMGQYQPVQPAPVQRSVIPQPMQQMTAPQGFAMRPVTSREEAVVAQIPFDGSTSWFYDTACDKVYSKTYDFNTGSAPVMTWMREQPTPAMRYATLEDLYKLRDELMNGKAVNIDETV